jgi:hypothetical protein
VGFREETYKPRFFLPWPSMVAGEGGALLVRLLAFPPTKYKTLFFFAN